MKQLIEALGIRDVLLLLSGLAIRLIISKRRFDRRGLGGLQHFSNYWIALLITFCEWSLKWTANLLIVIGIINLLIK